MRTPNETLLDVDDAGAMPILDDLSIVEGSIDYPG